MLLRETIRKTKFLFHKSVHNLRSFLFGGYQKLPRSLSFNPFSRRSGNAGTYTKEKFYYEFYDQWQSDLKRLNMIDESKSNGLSAGVKSEEPELKNAAESNGGSVKRIEEEKEDREKEKNKKGIAGGGGGGGGGARVLAQKMRDMEMMDAGDVEHLLDIEEALHYYSRLKSPVYLDIVDKFFMDMHSEISVPPVLAAPNS